MNNHALTVRHQAVSVHITIYQIRAEVIVVVVVVIAIATKAAATDRAEDITTVRSKVAAEEDIANARKVVEEVAIVIALKQAAVAVTDRVVDITTAHKAVVADTVIVVKVVKVARAVADTVRAEDLMIGIRVVMAEADSRVEHRQESLQEGSIRTVVNLMKRMKIVGIESPIPNSAESCTSASWKADLIRMNSEDFLEFVLLLWAYSLFVYVRIISLIFSN